jgi:menaquinone-dependent protoporphyrinogen IX oxidase
MGQHKVNIFLKNIAIMLDKHCNAWYCYNIKIEEDDMSKARFTAERSMDNGKPCAEFVLQFAGASDDDMRAWMQDNGFVLSCAIGGRYTRKITDQTEALALQAKMRDLRDAGKITA